MALAIASTVTWGANSSTATSHTSGTITANAGDYIVVAVATGYDATGATQPGITDTSSGGPLSWAQRITAGSSANFGFATVWTVLVSGTPGTFTITLNNFASGTHGVTAAAWVVTGAKADQTGAATASRDSGSGSAVLNADLNVSATGSLLFAAIDRGNSTTDPTWRADCTDDVFGAHFQASSGGDCSVGHFTNTTSATGSQLVGSDTSDTFTITAGIEVLAGSDVVVTETLGLSDSIAVRNQWLPYTWFQQNAFQSNAFAILGGTTGGGGPAGTHTDTLGLSDPQSSAQSQTSSETDTLGFSDPQTAAAGKTSTEGPETLGFSDSQTSSVRKAASETDTLGLSDSQASLQSQTSSQTDTLGFSDPQVATRASTASQADTLGFSDPQDAVQGQAGSETDTLGFSDPQASAVSGGGTLSGSHTDTLGFSDSQAATRASTASQTDTLGFSDTQTAAAGKSSAGTDTLGFSDGQDAVIGKAVTLSEALGMADAYAAAVSGGTTFSKTELDTLGLSDSYAAANSAIQGSHVDRLGMSDSYAAAVSGAVVFKQRFHVWSGTGWV